MSPGFHVLAVHRFGVWAHGLGRMGLPLRLLHLVLEYFVETIYGCELPHEAIVGRRVAFAHAATGIVVSPMARIGDDCLIRHNVTIGLVGDPTKDTRGPHLGDRVEVGAGAVIFGPIDIGDDTLVGPNAVVQESVPPRSIVRPARPEIKPRRRPADEVKRAG